MTSGNLESLPIAYSSDAATSAASPRDEAATGFQQQLEEAQRRPEPRAGAAADDMERQPRATTDEPVAERPSTANRPQKVDAGVPVEPEPQLGVDESRDAQQLAPIVRAWAKTPPPEAVESMRAGKKSEVAADLGAPAHRATKDRGARPTKPASQSQQQTAATENAAVAEPGTVKPVAMDEAASMIKIAPADANLSAGRSSLPNVPPVTKQVVADGAASPRLRKDAKAPATIAATAVETPVPSSDSASVDPISPRSLATANATPESTERAVLAANVGTPAPASSVAAAPRTIPVDVRPASRRAIANVEEPERDAAQLDVKPAKQETLAIPVVEGVLDRPSSTASAAPDDGANGDDRVSGEFCRPAPAPPVEGLKPPAIQLGPRGVDEAAGAVNLSAVDRARFMQRVSRAIHSAVDGGGQMKLRLSPPELGSLKLEVTLRDGGLSVRFEAETPQARALLIESAPALRERLSEQNVTLDRYEAELMQQPGEQAEQFRRPSRDDRETRFDGNERRSNKPPAIASEATPRKPGSLGVDGRLNVVV